MRSTRLVLSVVVCLVLLSARTIFAQAALDCATLVNQSLSDLGNSCRDLADGSLCYGHKSVSVQSNSSNSVSFQKPADQLPLSTVESLVTAPANLSNGEWGLALASMIPANSTTAVRMMLMGDAKLSLAPTVPTSLQFSTAFGAATCGETPSLAAIETTGDMPTVLKINGIDAQSTSLVIFQQESANAIKAIVYSGSFAINGGATAQAGQTLAGVMDNEGVILFWSAPRPTNENESKAANVVVNAFSSLGIIQPTPIPPLPTSIPLQPTEAPASNGESCGEGVTHVVEVGENLFRIAMRYGTSIGAIQKANNISDANQIVVGQTLVIPCGVDSGSSSVAPGTNTSGTEQTATPGGATPIPAIPTNQQIDCSAFNGSLPPNAPIEFQKLFNQFCSHP